MQAYVLFSWAFAALVGLVEGLRWRPDKRRDFLTTISVTFVIVFTIAPTLLFLAPAHSPAFLKFTWMDHLPSDVRLYYSIMGVVVVSYVFICTGFYLPVRGEFVGSQRDLSKFYLKAGLTFLLFGIVTFIAFLEIVGGPVYAFTHAWLFRSGTPDNGGATDFAFVKRLSLFILPGSVFLVQAASHTKRNIPAFTLLACVGVFCALILLVFMQGRLILLLYILPILLSMWALRRTATRRALILNLCAVAAIFGTIYVVGNITKPISAVVMELGPSAPSRGALPPGGLNLAEKLSYFGMEFAFPFVNLTNVLNQVPRDTGYRWFSDLILPVFHLIPKRLIPIKDYLPPRLFELNTRAQVGSVQWGIPVDLISFGWYSLGATGVLVVSLGFGRLARLLEMAMPSGNYGDEIFRYSWMLMTGALIMYGDPNWIFIELFHWNIALIIFLIAAVRYRRPGILLQAAPKQPG